MTAGDATDDGVEAAARRSLSRRMGRLAAMAGAGVVGAMVAFFVAALIAPTPQASGPPPPAVMSWPAAETLQPDRAAPPAPLGTALAGVTARGAPTSVSCPRGTTTCWGLAVVRGAECPVLRTRAGAPWRVGGPSLPAPSRSATAVLQAVGPGAVAVLRAGAPFFVTTDGGRRWSTARLGDADGVVALGRESATRGGLRLLTTSPFAVTDVRAYDTSDGVLLVLQPRTVTVVVPSVLGVRLGAATRRLGVLGLVANAVVPRSSTIPLSLLTIASQAPVAGAHARLGTGVSLTVNLPRGVR